jgi:hypothetical protein
MVYSIEPLFLCDTRCTRLAYQASRNNPERQSF